MDYITFCYKENLISSSFLVHFRPHTGFTVGGFNIEVCAFIFDKNFTFNSVTGYVLDIIYVRIFGFYFFTACLAC